MIRLLKYFLRLKSMVRVRSNYTQNSQTTSYNFKITKSFAGQLSPEELSGYMGLSDYSFFNCTSYKGDGYDLDCLSGPAYNIFAYTSDYRISYTDLTNCTKLYNLSSVPSEIFEMKNILYLNWSLPGCQQCEQQRKFCKLKKNITATLETECYDKHESKKDIKKKIEAADWKVTDKPNSNGYLNI
ncbi:hypothetical protein SADUNF_Sadunf15G0016200 [Salix dunnii]|uniref:RING-type E3 ubiquitin transferase n=1 Tax=Salix dunnii TaxID=1413687 RepID=A0A835MI56_9ROSI|nr:hypothetical protein SADUNF_Sadunf15G0016200 [Salix dunnii]